MLHKYIPLSGSIYIFWKQKVNSNTSSYYDRMTDHTEWNIDSIQFIIVGQPLKSPSWWTYSCIDNFLNTIVFELVCEKIVHYMSYVFQQQNTAKESGNLKSFWVHSLQFGRNICFDHSLCSQCFIDGTCNVCDNGVCR